MNMETTSTLSQELLRAAVTAEPEIAEKVQALVETIEGMIRSEQDAGEFAGLEQLAEDGRVMRFVADMLNELPEAVTYSDKGFEAYVMLSPCHGKMRHCGMCSGYQVGISTTDATGNCCICAGYCPSIRNGGI